MPPPVTAPAAPPKPMLLRGVYTNADEVVPQRPWVRRVSPDVVAPASLQSATVDQLLRKLTPVLQGGTAAQLQEALRSIPPLTMRLSESLRLEVLATIASVRPSLATQSRLLAAMQAMKFGSAELLASEGESLDHDGLRRAAPRSFSRPLWPATRSTPGCWPPTRP